MGRFVALDRPELDRLVEESCASIGRENESLAVPHLVGVVLGGGYGRGEGGVMERGTGNGERGTGNGEMLSNDLDFFVVADGDIPEAEAVASIGAALKPVSEKWTKRLGVDVDFAVKTRWRLKHDEERIMVQELLRGYFDVAGEKGAAMFDGIERRPAESLPWMEAARLLMNRGMGLLFAGEGGERETGFVARNINKCILGAGDARLVARRRYAWRAEDRAKALGDALYSAALDWKFKPGEEPVCGWETARKVWQEAFYEVYESSRASSSRLSRQSSASRSLRSALRWIVRRRSLGELRTLGLDPVVRILQAVSRHVGERTPPGASLLRDWEIFN